MDWSNICKVMRYADCRNETEYQGFIKEMILEEKLGWNPSQITEQLSLQLGSTERLVPDLVVSKDDRNSFIVEVKKPGHKKTHGDIEQLLSYMKQLETPVGIYWGDEVEVYYKTIGDGSAPILLMSLNFNVLSEDGDTFVSLFSEEIYSLDAVRAFKDEREAKHAFGLKVSELLDEVMSPEFPGMVKGLICDYFLSKGLSNDVVETVIDKVMVSISNDEEKTVGEGEINSVYPMEKIYKSRSRRSIGARSFAYNLMRQIIEKNCNLSYRELCGLFRKRNFIEDVCAIDEKRMDRWFLQPDEIMTLTDGTKVAISNQWGFNNNSKPKMDFLREVAERFNIDTSLPE